MTNDLIDDSSTTMHNTTTDKDGNNARCKTLSPSEDLYTQSLLNDHTDHLGESDMAKEYYSLHLDIERDTDLILDDFNVHHHHHHQQHEMDYCEDDSLDLYKNHHHDLCSSHDSLFSPNSNIQHVTKRRRSTPRTSTLSSSGTSASNATTNNNHLHSHNHHLHNHHHHHHHNHQVFQHAVDPMDMIKSSPTLAQLNLNSNDDPTDNLWDNSTIVTSAPPTNNSTSILTSATSTALASSTSAVATTLSSSTDLSNCTSLINRSSSSSITCPTHSQLSACHNHHHHFHQNHHNPIQASHSAAGPTSPFAVNLNNNNNNNQILPACHAHHHQANNCLAPVRGNENHDNHSPCCQNQHMGAQMPLAINQHNASCHHNQSLNGIKIPAAQNQMVGGEKQHQPSPPVDQRSLQHQMPQRSSSPALVTSSSSPLSSSTSTTSNTTDNRQMSDNKLKENIDYLTSLLCNGNGKLEQNPMNPNNVQQSTISSTMVKSYATLAQSLSTGPKLLERPYHQQHPNHLPPRIHHNHQHQHHQQQQQPSPVFNNNNNYDRQGEAIMRPGPEHWFKPAIESSISAADSTAESQQMNLNNNNNNNGLCSQYATPAANQQMLSSIDNPMHQSKGSELRVLSSLLNSKCPPSAMAQARSCHSWPAECNQQQDHLINPPITTQAQQHILMNQYQLSQQQHQQQLTTELSNKHEPASIPPNGRPITLTPLVQNNGIIVQQKQQQSKPPLFAQPASPSASSTASSGGHSGQVMKQTNSERSGRPNSMSTDGSLSSHDEGFSSQIDNDDSGSTRADSDEDDDVDSDDESFYGDYTNNDLIGASISDNPECKWTLNMGRTRRNGQRRFFWQYNVQSKGPKGARICPTDGTEDPFVLPEASDPVFSNDCQIEGVKHSGKARRGDGNDLTPNPRKLLMIGLELKKLGKIINDLVPVTDLPLNARNKTRKEKNKLASRACRLKKKAQHEANKIKLYGLQREHQQVVLAIYDTRKYLREKLLDNNGDLIVSTSSSSSRRTPTLGSNFTTIAERCSMKVAGQTSDYVNSVLEKVVSGCIDGGLST